MVSGAIADHGDLALRSAPDTRRARPRFIGAGDHRSETFAHRGARATAAQFGVDFLAEIPLDLEVRETSDSGRPIVVSDRGHPIAEAYRNLALSVRDKVAAAKGGATRAFPNIVYM